jgi:hypothetical protein
MKTSEKVLLTGSYVATTNSEAVWLEQLYGFSVQFSYGGTLPVGSVVVQGTNDDIDSPTVTPVWSDEIGGFAIAAAGSQMLNFDHRYYKYFRVRLVVTSGTITMRAKFVAKGP